MKLRQAEKILNTKRKRVVFQNHRCIECISKNGKNFPLHTYNKALRKFGVPQ